MTKDVKQEENAGKIKILNSGVNENEIDMMENKEEDDGEENRVTREAQPKKQENPASNIDMIAALSGDVFTQTLRVDYT